MNIRKTLLGGVSALMIAVAQCNAQSPPNPAFFYNFVPRPDQWNSFFSQKADYPGLLSSSNVWTGPQTYNSNLTVNGSMSVTGNLTVAGTLSASIQPLAGQFQFLVGNAGGLAVPTTLSGDCTNGSAGIVCTKSNGVLLATIATIPSASNLTSGTLSPALLPAFSGDVATAAGSSVTTIQPAAVTGAKTALATLTGGTGGNVAGSTIALSNIVQATPNTIVCNSGTATATLQFCGTAPSSAIPAINLAASGNGGVTGNLPVTNLNSGGSASSATYWSGAGVWQVPVGGEVLLNTLNATASASLSDTSSLTSGSFTSYELVFINLVPANGTVSPQLLVHSGGVFQTGSYNTVVLRATSGGAATTSGTANLVLHTTAASSAPGFSGRLLVSNPSGSTSPKMWTGNVSILDASSSVETGIMAGYWNNNAVVDGFQFLFSAGNITSGQIKIYGIP